MTLSSGRADHARCSTVFAAALWRCAAGRFPDAGEVHDDAVPAGDVAARRCRVGEAGDVVVVVGRFGFLPPM
jgi:hypothetical protein